MRILYNKLTANIKDNVYADIKRYVFNLTENEKHAIANDINLMLFQFSAMSSSQIGELPNVYKDNIARGIGILHAMQEEYNSYQSFAKN